MSDNNTANDKALSGALNGAGAALDAFAQGPVQRGAAALEQAFSKASRAIASDLSRAAAQGEASFKRLAASALSDLARIAIERIIPAAPSSNQGAGFLRDAAAGAFGAAISKSITVNMQVHGVQAEGFSRSKGQVAQSLAQAVSDGMRRL